MTDAQIAATERRLAGMDNAERNPSLGKRIGKGLSDFAKNMPKAGQVPAAEGSSGDAGLEGLGQQVAAEGQAAAQRTAQSAAQEYERAAHLLDAPQIQSPEQLASLRPGQAFRGPDGRLRYYMPERQMQEADQFGARPM
jgi:hypothetical protein